MEALQMSTWNDKRLEEGFKEAKREMRTGFARVDREIKDVRQEMRAGFARVDEEIKDVRAEMKDGFARVDKRFEKVEGEVKEGFAQARNDMNQRFNTLTALVGTLTVVVVGAGIFG